MRELMRRVFKLSIPIAVIAVAAGCGGSGSSSSPSSGGSSTPAAGTPQKGGTLTILASSAFGVADPAQNYTLQQWAFLIDTHDGLVAFKRVGGTEGTQIVPDLAEQIPQPTDGGKTYTFQIRKGIKFSDGTTMKPSDFVTTFERQFTVPGPTSFYSGIVGTDKCTAKNCDLSQGVVADDSASTLTIHLTAADPEFLDKLALPFAFVVPGNTSPKLTGNNVPPGTGPYMWQSYDPNKEAVLVRNPNFKVWNPDAQPEGYPDKIVEKYGLQVSDEVTAVENDQADVVFAGDTIPSDRLNELGTQYASQTHVNALTADWYMALNTQTPPFNNLKARQAINYAFDRGAAVKLAGGSSLAVPTCQVLPPNFPGYVQYCPYTANATSDGAGAWTAPDYTKAKQLVQDSGTAGTKVVVNTDGPDKPFGEQMVSD
ncbi:MAG: ABC transporter substrate-binding protein, partial [Gaiellales bacterium]